MINAGVVVCCCTDTTDECVKIVRDWCKDQGYTADDVKIAKRNGSVIAESKRELK